MTHLGMDRTPFNVSNVEVEGILLESVHPRETKIGGVSVGWTTSRGSKPCNSKETVNDLIREADHRYHNPDPLYQFIGPANEAETIVEGVKLMTLIDSGTQCSSISLDMVQKMGLELKSLDTLCLRGGEGMRLDIWGTPNAPLKFLRSLGSRKMFCY